MQIGFDSPEYLWLLLGGVPFIAWLAWHHLGMMGRVRAATTLLFRLLVLTTLVVAIAGIRVNWISDRVTVIYVLDQSDSIDQEVRQQMLQHVIENVRQHRDQRRNDLAGVIIFGKEAALEIPPFADDLPKLAGLSELEIRTDATDLESALKLAAASFPSDTLKRIVLITDGNETNGVAQQAAVRNAESGIGIDVVPVSLRAIADVAIEQLDLPDEIRHGQPFEARIVVSNFTSSNAPTSVAGRLTVTQNSMGNTSLILDQAIELPPGKSVFPLRHQIDAPGAYTFEAQFTPADPGSEARAENNRAGSFARVRGKSRVLLIAPSDDQDSWELFANRLRDEQIEVVIQPSSATFSSLAELQGYDSVILANVPRTSGESVATLSSFSDAQVEMLVRNTQQLGAGLLLVGGPDAFGAGGWTGTELEKMMPVDFEIKNTLVTAVGALMLVIDSSGSMSGEKLDLCKVAAREAVKALGPQDYVGVLTFDSETREIVPLQQVGGRDHVIPLISRIASGGGTDLFPAMNRAFTALSGNSASVKHMIVLTDGQTPPSDFQGLTQRIRAAGITVSSVAIGKDADVRLMNRISTLGGGKLYHVLSPRAIPQIVMRESRRVSRPLIYEEPGGFLPQVQQAGHLILNGVDSPLPVTGYVLTTPKDNPLVQMLLIAPRPAGQENPLLAVWQYGLGRTAVLATDGGQRWADQWSEWPGHQKLLGQLMRWLMRPSGQNLDFSLVTTLRGGQVEVVVDALNPKDGFVNFLEMRGSVLDPQLKPMDLELSQSSPGRYVGSFPVDRAGSYLISVAPGNGNAPLITGVTLPFGKEYRDRESNWSLLNQIAAVKPRAGSVGEVSKPLNEEPQLAMKSNPFCPGLESISAVQDVWPWLVLTGCCLFLGDVMVRRVRFDISSWFAVRRTQSGETSEIARLRAVQTMKDQLRATKESQRRYAATFAPENVAPSSPLLDSVPVAQESQRSSENRASSTITVDGGGQEPEPQSTQSYTQRLLEAKRRARRG